LLANLYMHRFLKLWRMKGCGEAFRAHLVNDADDFVSRSRGHAHQALASAPENRVSLADPPLETVTELLYPSMCWFGARQCDRSYSFRSQFFVSCSR
jgi:hypothetical protein